MDNVIVFGDSVCKGVIFEQTRNRYALLKDNFINIVAEKFHINVKNYAKMGLTITEGCEILDKHKNEMPDSYVVLEFGGNDCDHDWAAIAENPDKVHIPKTTDSDFYIIYKKIINEIRDAGGIPILFNLPPIDSVKYFNWFSQNMDESQKNNIIKWLGGSVDYIFRWHDGYNKRVTSLALEEEIIHFDIRSEFLKKNDYSAYLCTDGIHPNEMGHKMIADFLASKLSGKICSV